MRGAILAQKAPETISLRWELTAFPKHTIAGLMGYSFWREGAGTGKKGKVEKVVVKQERREGKE